LTDHADLRARLPLLLSGAAVGVLLLIAAVPAPFAGLFGHGDPHACVLTDSAAGPRSGHPFGFDVQGCDLYANVVYGARSSIALGLLVTGGCLLVAVTLGTLAAYHRGWVDMVISRLMDVIFGFPALVGMVVILTTLGRRDVWTVAGVLVVFSWPALTRVMRASALACVDRDYVEAVAGLGAGSVRIMVRHVVPNALAPVLVLASLAVGAMITAESALTFLGVGLQQPAISWGVQLNEAKGGFRTHLHLLLAPALTLSVAVLVFVLFGEALRQRLDPVAGRGSR